MGWQHIHYVPIVDPWSQQYARSMPPIPVKTRDKSKFFRAGKLETKKKRGTETAQIPKGYEVVSTRSWIVDKNCRERYYYNYSEYVPLCFPLPFTRAAVPCVVISSSPVYCILGNVDAAVDDDVATRRRVCRDCRGWEAACRPSHGP